MALIKPLVIINGQLQQLQATDTLDADVLQVDVTNLTNGGATSAIIGQAAVVTGSNSFVLGRADASGTKNVVGLVRSTSIAAAATGSVQTDGVLVATLAQWNAITGQTSGLTPGANYFLSPTTAGNITPTAPTASGQYLIKVGTALSTTAMDINTGAIDILL